MRKKVFCLILSFIMILPVLSGCSLLEDDVARAKNTVMAVVESVEIKDDLSNDVFVTEAHEIRYYEVESLISQNLQGLQSNNYTAEQMVDWALEYLIMNRIVVNEADAVIKFGNVMWGNYQESLIKKQIFTTIDSELRAARNEILELKNQPATNEQTQEEEVFDTSSRTYPVKEEVTPGKYDSYTRAELVAAAKARIDADTTILSDAQKQNLLTLISGTVAEGEDGEDMTYSTSQLIGLLENYDKQAEYETVWAPSLSRYPGLYGTEAQKSLEKSAMLRFITSLKELVEEDYRLTDKQRKAFAAELKEIEKIKNVPYMYPALGDTELMMFLVGDNYANTLKIELLQESLDNSASVSDNEITEYYGNLLAEQKSKYSTDAAYDSAVRAGVDLQLYIPNDSLYFVKHILLPFSDAQKAELESYKTSAEYGRDGEDGLKAFKENLAKGIETYVHVDGEDYGEPIPVSVVSDEIYATMNRQTTMKARTTAFDDLIYKYNTDGGIFGKQYGYAVKKTDGDDIDTQYMVEFSEAAKTLYEEGGTGSIGGEGGISEWAVTDYGIHILFLSKKPTRSETLTLNDYTSVAAYDTVKSQISALRLSEKLEAVYSNWSRSKQNFYLGKDSKAVTRKTKAINKMIKEING